MARSDSVGEGNVSKALATTGAQLQKLVTIAVTDGVGPMNGAVAYADARLATQLAGGSSGGVIGTVWTHRPGGPKGPSDPTGPTYPSGPSGPSDAVAAEAAIKRIINESVAAAP
jgi:hypothetical protein